MLKRAGYTTGIVGKWHLGLGTTPTNYNAEIKPGPLEIGFDYCWIMPATGDRVPCVWVENHRVANLDPADPIRSDYSVERGAPRSFIHGIPRIGAQEGGKAALWDDENMSTVIAEKSCAFIERNKDKPFFLEVATHNIHVPRVPNPKFRGASQCGPRGDTIVEFDWTAGQVLDTLDRLKLTENTLVIITSDNGGMSGQQRPGRGPRHRPAAGQQRAPLQRRAPRREGHGLGRRHAAAADRPLAGPYPARRLGRTGLPGGHAGQLRRPDRAEARPGRRRRTASTCCPNCWVRRWKSRAASIWSSRTTTAMSLPSATARGS